MKLKTAPNSLFAILLRKPWWVSIALVGVIALAARARALVPQPYVVFGMMGGSTRRSALPGKTGCSWCVTWIWRK